MIKAVIFDLDDTLYDASSCYEKGMFQLALYAEKQFKIAVDEFEIKFREARERVKLRLGNVAASHNRLLYIQTFLEKMNKKPLERGMEMYDIYWEAVLDKMELYPYVIPLFSMLHKKNIRIVLLSDLTAHIQYRKIERLELAPWIDVLVTSEEVGEEKPSKKMFQSVMEKTGCSPEELLMVGNSKEHDITGANRIGIKAILYRDNMNIVEEVIKML